ncbi:MAG: DNA repair protein RecO [Leadbetterella sp.]
MLHKTRGIVLSYIPYKETSIVCQIFTEKFGLQSYIENGVRTAKGRAKMGFFQPMSILDLVVYQNQKKDIQRLSEFQFYKSLHSIHMDPSKSAICMFLCECIHKSLHGGEINTILYQFIENGIILLDHMKDDYEDFHLYFLKQMSQYLGFGSSGLEGVMEQFRQHHVHMSNELESHFGKLYNSEFGSKLDISRVTRNQLLDGVLMYYTFFNDKFSQIKTIDVLRSTLS